MHLMPKLMPNQCERMVYCKKECCIVILKSVGITSFWERTGTKK